MTSPPDTELYAATVAAAAAMRFRYAAPHWDNDAEITGSMSKLNFSINQSKTSAFTQWLRLSLCEAVSLFSLPISPHVNGSSISAPLLIVW